MRGTIETSNDPDPDPEADGVFLENMSSESVANEISSESMVVVLNNDVTTHHTTSNVSDETQSNSNIASLQSPIAPDTSGAVSNVNLKTPVTPKNYSKKPSTREPSIKEPSKRTPSIREPSLREPSIKEASIKGSSVRHSTVDSTVPQSVQVPISPRGDDVYQHGPSIGGIPHDENKNQNQTSHPRSNFFDNSQQKTTVSFVPNTIISFPVIVETETQGDLANKDKDEPKPTPTPTGSIHPPVIPGPGVLPSATDVSEIPDINPPPTCPKCGQKIDAPDTKMIPKAQVWGLFAGLFFCGCWFLSWIPFLIKCWHEPVEICPYCYRRLHRKPIASNSVHTDD